MGTERETQHGDGEVAECHVCGKTFSTQAELLMHLEDQHPDDILPDPAEM